jgi:CRISPR system Cascade subunit CasB
VSAPERASIDLDAARRWWVELQPTGPDGTPNRDGDRGALARLRRAESLAESMAEGATLRLYTALGLPREEMEVRRWLPQVAVLAHVLAHVRADEPPGEGGCRRSAIAAVGRRSMDDKDSAALKPIRFRRLLAAREPEELMREMRRLAALADRRLNVADLTGAILYWNDDTRARWAFDYHAAGMAAPRASGETGATP